MLEHLSVFYDIVFGIILKGTLLAFIQALLWIFLLSTDVPGAVQTIDDTHTSTGQNWSGPYVRR